MMSGMLNPTTRDSQQGRRGCVTSRHNHGTDMSQLIDVTLRTRRYIEAYSTTRTDYTHG